MSVPLTTILDPDSYHVTALKAMNEFLSTYFTADLSFDAQIETLEVNVTDPLSKPLIQFSLNGGDSIPSGAVGLSSENTLSGEYKNFSWTIHVITDDSCGGMLTLSKYTGYLDMIIRKHGYYLSKAGLRKPRLFPPVIVPSDHFYHHTFTLTTQSLLTWEAE